MYKLLQEKENCIAILSIAETNIKDEVKEYNELARSYKNPSTQ